MNKPITRLAPNLHDEQISIDSSFSAIDRRVRRPRIMLVIPGRLFRNGIELVLQSTDSEIVGDCETLDDVESTLQERPDLCPDLFVIAIHASARAATDFLRIRALRVKLPDARWIVLSSGGGPDFWRQAVESGINGALREDSAGEVLQLLVRLVLRGYSCLPEGLPLASVDQQRAMAVTPAPLAFLEPELSRDGWAESAAPEAPPDHEPSQRWKTGLSDRESDILRGLVAGQSNKAIARDLGISEATVKVHVKALLRKMQVTNRTQAAISALEFLRRPTRAAKPISPLTFSAVGS